MTRVDSKTLERVIAALLKDPNATASLIEVNHDHGEVTLSGTVLSQEARQATEELIRRQQGVQRIVNNLCVAPACRTRNQPDEPGSLLEVALTH
jgi:osmotically-inducible protein OsmY